MNSKLKLYFIGIGWFVLSLVSSAINDVISKYIGVRLHSYQITFLRFVFGTITLIPFIMYYGVSTLKTSIARVHIVRGLLLFLGIAAWTHGFTVANITTGTIVSFTVPIFVLLLGIFFLKEHIIWQRWVATIFVFLGIVVTLNPTSESFGLDNMVFIAAAVCFAILDIINKNVVIHESMIGMLFYSAIVTSLFALPFALSYWVAPNIKELLLLFALGGSANLLLFFLLKAFAVVDATALSPYRYFELLVSGTIAYIVFNEIPNKTTIIGAILIIPATLFVINSEKRQLKD